MDDKQSNITNSMDFNAPKRPEPNENHLTASDVVIDGGMAAWSSLFGGWLVLFATFGYTNSFGVYQDYYTRRSHTASASQISWIGATQLFLLLSTGIFAGKLVDLGYFRATIFCGSLLYVFSIFMLSISHPGDYYQLFLSQGIGMGLGSGIVYIPSLAVQAHHWQKHRAMALGVTLTGTAFGGIIFPIMLNSLLDRVGFAWSVRASGLVVMVLLSVANVLMRPRAPPTVAVNRNTVVPQPKMGDLFADVPYVLFIAGTFFCLISFFYPYFYVQLLSVSCGVDTTVAFYMLSILNISSIPGRVLPNLLIPKYGVFNVLLLCCSAYAIITFALLGISSVAGLVVYTIVSGFCTGAIATLLSAAAASFAREQSEVGLRMGLVYALGALGSLVGAPINGALLGTGSEFAWAKSIVFTGVSVVVTVLVFAVPRGLLARIRGPGTVFV